MDGVAVELGNPVAIHAADGVPGERGEKIAVGEDDVKPRRTRKATSPTATLSASVSFNLPSAGTYYVIVEGVGFGNPLNTGYSDYGSVGQYPVGGSVTRP